MEPDENLDLNLNGENTETPGASPAQTITTGDGSQVNPNGAENLSPEEVSWNSLKGGTQDRIKSILKERNEWMAKAERAERVAAMAPVTPQPTYTAPVVNDTPEVKDAVRKLSEVGIATQDGVREEINKTIGGLVYNMELEKLSNRLNGENGLPKFDRDEYEDYIQKHPQYRSYSPEDVYNKMYEDEIFDWKLQNQGKPRTQSATPSLRPTKTTIREDALTPESIETRLKQPDGAQWYERNKEKINTVLASMASSDS